MHELIKPIVDYMDYLINEKRLKISICRMHEFFLQFISVLVPYNKHANTYCEYVKTSPELFQKCMEKQHKVMQKSADGEFYGKCWAGVEEFVFPIKSEKALLGFISVTGYRSTDPETNEPRMREISNFAPISYQTLNQHYLSLSNTPPSMKRVRTLITPLCAMFELLYMKEKDNVVIDVSLSLYKNILDYLYNNFNTEISPSDVARHCKFSESYIRHVFKEKSGYSIKHYTTILRLKRAKELLIYSRRNIISIATEIGYNDSNYFSNLFKKATGLSPKDYRNKHIAHNKL